jgi:hypothetical protein
MLGKKGRESLNSSDNKAQPLKNDHHLGTLHTEKSVEQALGKVKPFSDLVAYAPTYSIKEHIGGDCCSVFESQNNEDLLELVFHDVDVDGLTKEAEI